MDQVGLKGGDGFAQHLMVLGLAGAQFAVTCQPRMLVDPVENQPAIHFAAPLFVDHAMPRGEHFHRVAPGPERLGLYLATQVVGTRMVWGVEMGEDENLHAAREL